jgi:hypothetical protein
MLCSGTDLLLDVDGRITLNVIIEKLIPDIALHLD